MSDKFFTNVAVNPVIHHIGPASTREINSVPETPAYIIIDQNYNSLDAARHRFNDFSLPGSEEGITLYDTLAEAVRTADILTGFGICEKAYVVDCNVYIEALENGNVLFAG